MSGEQLLLHREADPGPGLAHVSLDLTHVLDVSAGETAGSGVGEGKRTQRHEVKQMDEEAEGVSF